METAFLYLWFDAKNKKFYLGYHKGTPFDGYTHSSSVMESFTEKTKPKYMKRRILATGDPAEIYELETYLLQKIKNSKKVKKYYNISTNNISESRFDYLESNGMVHPFKTTEDKILADVEHFNLYNGSIQIYKKNNVYWTKHKMKSYGRVPWKTVESSTKQKNLFDACVVATMLETSDRTGKSCDYDTAVNKVKKELC